MSVSRPLALALAAAVGALAHGALSSPLGAQIVEGRSYFFRLQTPDDGPTEGVMHVAGDFPELKVQLWAIRGST